MPKFSVLILTYIALCIFIFLIQRKLEYMPYGSLLKPDEHGFHEAKDHFYRSFDEVKLAYWQTSSEHDNIILYFHGNAGNLGDRADKLAYLHRFTNYNLAALSYRGYPGSSGKPSEQAFHKDAEYLLKILLEQGYKLNNIILYGESLGSALAIKLASKYKVKAVFLEAPFWSASEIAKKSYWYLPVELLMIDKYESHKYLNKIRSPTYMIHGTKDRVTPVTHSRKIYDNLGGDIFKRKKEIIGADHLEFYPETLANELVNFIAEINADN